jgi:hypothetical protein
MLAKTIGTANASSERMIGPSVNDDFERMAAAGDHCTLRQGFE